MSQAAKEQLKEVLTVFNQRKSDGDFVYADEDVRAFLPALVISTRVSFHELPALKKLMQDFLGQLGLPPGASNETIGKAIDAHFRANPLNPGLLRDFQQLLREQAGKTDNADARKALESMAKGLAKPGAPAGLAPPTGGAGFRKR
ncbi:MAG: hypothetical protein AAF219_08785 [Myxococcota bacterium]